VHVGHEQHCFGRLEAMNDHAGLIVRGKIVDRRIELDKSDYVAGFVTRISHRRPTRVRQSDYPDRKGDHGSNYAKRTTRDTIDANSEPRSNKGMNEPKRLFRLCSIELCCIVLRVRALEFSITALGAEKQQQAYVEPQRRSAAVTALVGDVPFEESGFGLEAKLCVWPDRVERFFALHGCIGAVLSDFSTT
jgi:hypothetical protein